MKNEHTLAVTLEGKEWTSVLDKIFNKKNKDAKIDGFRKGKAPKEIFLKKFGIEILYQDAIDEALPSAYEKVMKESKLIPACRPRVDVKSIDENHVEFEFIVTTKPEVKVSSYKKLGVKMEEPKVTKEEIDAEIDGIRGRMAEIVVKESGAVSKGDTAVIDFEGFVDGVAFEGGKGTEYPLEIGSGSFIPGFEDQLIGSKKGDNVEVKVKFPEDYVADLKGKDAIFKVTVKEIREKILPELNEEFFKDLGYDDIKTAKEFEEKTKEHLLEHKKMDAENKYIDELLNAGISKMTVEVNDDIVEEEVERMVDDLAHRLEMQGIPLESYLQFTKTDLNEFKEQSKQPALNRIKSRYLIDYIIEKEDLKVTDKEVDAHAEEQAKKYEIDKEELIESYGGIEVVKYDLLVHKAIDVLKG